MQVKKLEGKKLYLGPLSLDHVSTIVKWMNDMEVLRHTLHIASNHTETSIMNFLEDMEKSEADHVYGIFSNEGKLLGTCALHDVNDANKTAVFGIIIGIKDFWNKGYGTEATNLLVDYAFNVLNYHNIMLTVSSDHQSAIKCYKKVGFKVFGTRREARFFGGKYYDDLYMDIIPSDFKNSKYT